VTKYLKSFLVVLLALAVASPALAELKVSGYYRLQGIATNSDDSSIDFGGQDSIEPNTQTLIDQRLRLKVDNILNEYVTVTWFGEVDGTWGMDGKDGGPGGDRISVETKNAYLDFKIPNSIFSVRTGLQGIGGRYQGVLLADDWSAAQVGMKFTDALNLVVLYAKPIEGSTTDWDDVDFYNAQLDLKTGAVNLGFDLAWLNKNSTTAYTGAGDSFVFTDPKPLDIYYAGVKADAKVGPVAVNGFFLYAFGSEDNATGDTSTEMDISGFATSVAAKVKVDVVDLGARAIYMSADDFDTNDEIESFVPNLGGNYDFTGENLMIFLTDAYYNNGPGGRLATNAATVDGVGLIGLTGQANVTLGQFYGKLGLGYFMAADTPAGVDDQMGFEGALRVGTKIADKVDFSLNGAYALLGDYWQDTAGLTDTPDDIWKGVAMLNVGF
jgi:hypothetical protein